MVGTADGEILRHDPLDIPTARDLLIEIERAGFDPVAFIDEHVYVAHESETARIVLAERRRRLPGGRASSRTGCRRRDEARHLGRAG